MYPVKKQKVKILGFVLILALMTLSGYFNKQTVSKSASTPLFQENENSIIFIGHATTLIHLNNLNILTDPNFNDWATVIPRSREAGVQIQLLPKVDVILISHAHRDHLDEWTLKQLPKNTTVLISKGNGEYLRKWGFKNVLELDIWEKTVIKGVKITAAPAKHSGARNSAFADYPRALSYVIQGEKTVYFAGDTGLFDGFKEIGNYSQIDVALLPVGAYRPRWFMESHHMSPDDAVLAMAMLGSTEMIPIHWGSFRMALDGVEEPKDVLLGQSGNSSLKERIHVLENGGKYVFK